MGNAMSDEVARLVDGLIELSNAPDSVPVEVFKSIAYDIAINCMDSDTAVFQMKARTVALKERASRRAGEGDGSSPHI